MSGKSNKNIGKIILWIVVGFLALDLTIVGLLFVPSIQTFAVNKITNSISDTWGSEISMKDIRITPTLKIVAHDFRIKDLRNNDMIYVGTVKGRLHAFSIKPLKLKFRQVELDQADIVLRTYRGDESVNISLWAHKIKKNREKSKSLLISSKNLQITNSRFVLIKDERRVIFDTKDNPDIDYGYLEFTNINLESKSFKITSKDFVDISTDIKHLALDQYAGFSMTDASGKFRICDTTLVFDNLSAKTTNSKLDLDLKFAYATWHTLGEFVDSVRIISTIRPSTLCMKDVAAFASSLKGMDETISLKASRFNGTVNNFSIIGLKAGWGFNTRIAGDIALKNVTNFKQASINVQIDSSKISIPELAVFKLPKGKTIPISRTIAKFGTTALKASFVGTPTIFDAEVDAHSNMGTLFANLSTFVDNGSLQLEGSVASPDLNLASLTNNHTILGTADLFVSFDGGMREAELSKKNFKTLKANLSGDINRIYIYGYNLRNSAIEAQYENSLYNCELTTNDKHFVCDINGQLDLRDDVPFLQSTIALDHFDAGAIANSLAKIDSTTAKGFNKLVVAAQRNPNVQIGFDNFMISLRGSKLDNINGYAGCDNIRVFNGEDSLANERFRLTAINTDVAHKYILSSNIANVSLETNYPVKDIKDSLQNIAHTYFPTLVPAVAASAHTGNLSVPGYIKAHVNTYRTRSVLRMLMPDLHIAPNSTIDITAGSQLENNSIYASSRYMSIKNKLKVHNLTVNGSSLENKSMKVNIVTDSAVIKLKSSNLVFEDINVAARASHDTIHYDLKWRNEVNEQLTDRSELSGFANISSTNDIEIAFRNSQLFLNEQRWQFNDDNNIHIQKGAVVVNNLVLTDSSSRIEANGTYSKTKQERLTVNITNVDMDVLNPLFSKFSCDGSLSANVNISNRNGKIFLYGKALANNFVFNEEKLGNVFLVAALDTTNKVYFNGGIFQSTSKLGSRSLANYSFLDFQNEPHRIANINGNYDQKKFTVHTTFDSLNTGFLSPFLSSFSDHIDGKASGNLDFVASPDSTYFDGKVHVDDVDMGIEALGTKYFVQDQYITFNPRGIFFDNMLLKDKDGNTAWLSGSVKHKMFRDMNIDLNITTDRIMVLNTPKSTNSVFYGIGYASGDISIRGDGYNLYFVGPNLTTLPGTKIYLQVNSANSASHSNIITFKPKDIAQTGDQSNTANHSTEKHSSLNFDFTFNVTHDADVILLLESIGGTMNARADGKFQLTYNDNESLNLYGLLKLHSGDFKLALYNVVNSKFTLVPDGSILFDGPLDNMVVNASAYKTSKTSLSNIIPQEYLNGNSANVKAYLHLNGQLMQNIEPTFSFELPNSSNEVRNLFYTAIDTANTENLTKQFVYFMVTNNFLPNDMFSSDRNTGGLGASGLNLFSNIVNNMFNNMFDSRNGSFGITYNQATETSSAEYGVKAGANLLKDRISLETSIGYYDDKNTQGFNNMYGDFSVEYSINKAGTWKLKAYTYIGERDENYIYDSQINYTAGIALAFKQDFNTPRRRNKTHSKQKKHKKNE